MVTVSLCGSITADRVSAETQTTDQMYALFACDHCDRRSQNRGAYTGAARYVLKTSSQWSNCGGTAFPFRFWRRNAVPLAYTMTATYNTSNIMEKCALDA